MYGLGMSSDLPAATPRWRQVLDEQGRTIAWLAERTGLAPQTVYAISAGTRRATPDWLDKVAAALGVPAAFLREDAA